MRSPAMKATLAGVLNMNLTHSTKSLIQQHCTRVLNAMSAGKNSINATIAIALA